MPDIQFTDNHEMIGSMAIGDIPAAFNVPGTTLKVITHGWQGMRPGVYREGVRDDELSHRLISRFMGDPPVLETVERIKAWLRDGAP